MIVTRNPIFSLLNNLKDIICGHVKKCVMLSIDNPYLEQMIGQKYLTEVQLNKAKSFNTEAFVLDLDFSITNDLVSSKIYEKRDAFNFEIVNFPFLDGSPSYSVYISHLFVLRKHFLLIVTSTTETIIVRLSISYNL